MINMSNPAILHFNPETNSFKPNSYFKLQLIQVAKKQYQEYKKIMNKLYYDEWTAF